MSFAAPMSLGLSLASAGATWWWQQRRAKQRDWLGSRIDELNRKGRDWSPDPGAWLGEMADQAGPRLSRAFETTRETVEPLVRGGSRFAADQAGRTRGRLDDLDFDADPGRWRRQAAEFGARAGETATEFGARAGETASFIKPIVGRVAADAGATLGTAGATATAAVGGVATGATKAAFGTLRDLAILGAVGSAILYIYAPERDQQQQVFETAQAVAYGVYDFARGVQQLIADLRAT